MRQIQERVRDYLTEILPLVAAHLGDEWTAAGHSLTAADGRRFCLAVHWWHHQTATARVSPAWERGYGEIPTVTVPATGHPEAIARTIREDLLPRCPVPLPHLTVHLSGRACRAAGYLDPASFEDLAEDVAGAAGRLLAGERSQGFGRSYRADLTQAEARALLEDWETLLEEGDVAGGDRSALRRDADRLRVRLDLLDRAQARDDIDRGEA